MTSIKDLISEAYRLFPESLRPGNFTDPEHCEECREHNDTLLASTREDISYDELGNPGWDPICFVNEAGFRYYFPALIRLALTGKDDEYYIDQFIFHITQNASCTGFTNEQVKFVVRVLEYLVEARADELEMFREADDILNAIEMWTNK